MKQTTLIEMSPADLQNLISDSIQKAILNKEDQWFTHEKAAEYLDISTSNLFKMKKDGKVKFYMIDSSPRYKKSDLDNIPKKI
jgi:hypothetical protein